MELGSPGGSADRASRIICGRQATLTIEPQRVADILAHSSVWTRLALTSAKESLRERAAETMAAYLCYKLAEPEGPVRDERQMALPIL